MIHYVGVAMLWSAYWSPTFIEGNGSAIWPPMMLYLTHRVMIALKYATLSPSEYKRFMSCHNMNIIGEYFDQMQIIKGIVVGGNQTMSQFELAAGAALLGIVDLEKFKFLVPVSSIPPTLLDLHKCADSGGTTTFDEICYPSNMGDWETFVNPGLCSLGMKHMGDISDSTVQEESQSININSEYKPPPISRGKSTRMRSGRNKHKVTPETQNSSSDVRDFNSDISSKVKESPRKGIEKVDSFKTQTNNVTIKSIPLSVAALALLSRDNPADRFIAMRILFPLGMCLIFVLMLQPFIVTFKDPFAFYKSDNFGDIYSPAYSIVFYICSTMISFIFAPVILLFLIGSIMVMLRRRSLSMNVHDMIKTFRNSDDILAINYNLKNTDQDLEYYGKSIGRIATKIETSPDFVFDHDARVSDIQEPSSNGLGMGMGIPVSNGIEVPILWIDNNAINVQTFLYMRLILQNYGMRMRFRFDFYLGQFRVICIYIVSLLVIFIVILFLVPGVDY